MRILLYVLRGGYAYRMTVVYHTPVGRFSMVDISTIGVAPVRNIWALETSRRKLSEDISSGVDTLLVIEQPRFENCPKGVLYTPSYTYNMIRIIS